MLPLQVEGPRVDFALNTYLDFSAWLKDLPKLPSNFAIIDAAIDSLEKKDPKFKQKDFETKVEDVKKLIQDAVTEASKGKVIFEGLNVTEYEIRTSLKSSRKQGSCVIL